MSKAIWKKGRGKLGPLSPLLGKWLADAESPMGPISCSREYKLVLGGTRIQLECRWQAKSFTYDELAIFGPDTEGKLIFNSFTSDGKSSNGYISDGTDVHPEAICFEAQMPAGIARQVFWPDEEGGFHWAVESKTKKGWKRFTSHHYRLIT